MVPCIPLQTDSLCFPAMCCLGAEPSTHPCTLQQITACPSPRSLRGVKCQHLSSKNLTDNKPPRCRIALGLPNQSPVQGWVCTGSSSQPVGWQPNQAQGRGNLRPQLGTRKQDPQKRTLEGSMTTVGTKLRKMWLQSVRTLVLLKATSSSSIASRSSRSPSFCRYSKEASCST